LTGRILVAGIGNIFHGDDAFGVEVAQRLMKSPFSEDVSIVDFGIRGFDLAFALLDGYEATILVDAIQRGGAPGTIFVMEPDLDNLDALIDSSPEGTSHEMNPARVLALTKQMGGPQGRVLLIGCEPLTFGSEEEGQMGLSDVVAEAVDVAILKIKALVSDLLGQIAAVNRLPQTQPN